MMSRGGIVAFVFFFHFVCGYCSSSNNDTIPDPGQCAGPLDRILWSREHWKLTNFGCPLHKVFFFPDEDSSKEGKCGECYPGTSGRSSSEKYCKSNEYCTDEGKCASILTHPNFQFDCPSHGQSKEQDFCGAGLYCIRHKCVQCVDWETDYETWETCYKGRWSRNYILYFLAQPSRLMLFITALSSMLYFAMKIAALMQNCIKKETNTQTKKKST
ncbi:uncharacterized protein MONOS_3433 [Monocercomonoides exilis]|uniref:uncharacterized protein n=1 Tax=Monocercomonoides exilis TaxID=2049356 RepID=UPI00355AB2CD|nr:hypothetical protein MONOS_3433 [Monocercomonoides exilis]|eukprot:MONOS_3433.1-p1 / transcript=MONOS_3433.1 / gene=MONOS_3433 / organism=Monocercomonoides_exilis_PA203 / gene_product=unspecified product / transcript_product=unspecified product / location=Mono_scaffold00081:33116-34045(+) / protein_length=215 / sequence_SO=supercontig / SO=protein_coding / is_pseudo=false